MVLVNALTDLAVELQSKYVSENMLHIIASYTVICTCTDTNIFGVLAVDIHNL